METTIILLTVAARLLTTFLAFLASYLPLFDASPVKSWLRWDVFHFSHIAREGYVYEHEWAFFPGLPFVIRRIEPDSIQWHMLMTAIACDTSVTLYRLSKHPPSHLVPGLSRHTALPPPQQSSYFSSCTLCRAFFHIFGLLYCATKEFYHATVCFTLAGFLRSNSIFLAGYIVWGLGPRQLHLSTLLTAVIFAPFIYHNLSAYLAFCPGADWCNKSIPLIYPYVQAKYWNVGLFNYWSFQQLPNFLIAAPPFLLLTAYSVHILKGSFTSSLVPHAIHALILSATLLFTSHTQIILRLAASLPITYWAAAWLIVEYRAWGKLWVGWSVLWGSISVVLWMTFLPPA
ncbi:glycosyltransferase family 76 protein [Desarmillaria tabescens]|uniref:GPI mannosyltransferase 2 n=1 Tax=Armillaria tabescens TaxID=1929756 RepID=A0AA39TW69_ARMTA|nr:glycosyltransferase family 76 protein [Desarmillaria tabescens]KAK0461400.1 glycosyltransferase family 76 protein [Desarmillaria tabescens]